MIVSESSDITHSVTDADHPTIDVSSIEEVVNMNTGSDKVGNKRNASSAKKTSPAEKKQKIAQKPAEEAQVMCLAYT